MNDFNLKPEFDLLADEDSVPTLVSGRRPGADGNGSAQNPMRGLRRRAGGLRLRAPSDDGFHLFRVY